LKHETLIGCAFLNSSARHKNSKTLSGIETPTHSYICSPEIPNRGTKTLKPYQGLKRSYVLGSVVGISFAQGTKTLKPYQGLKLSLLGP